MPLELTEPATDDPTGGVGAIADFFRDADAAQDSPLLWRLSRQQPLTQALSGLFHGPAALVQLRLWVFLQLASQGEALLPRERIAELFHALRPEALETVLKRLRDVGLLAWDEGARAYQLHAQLARLHGEFSDAIASGSEFRLREARKRYDRAATLIDRASEAIAATAAHVLQAFSDKLKAIAQPMRQSLTYDRGREMAEHQQLTQNTGMKVYFCDPYSPWQRGSNENTNGLLRQYFPKGTDLSGFTQEQLDAVADELNGRPRMTLGWSKPIEVYAEHLARLTQQPDSVH